MNEWDLDQSLIQLSQHDTLTTRELTKGTLVFGGTGCGKTSASMAALAYAFLDANFGGLVLTVKPDEAELWYQYALRTGREKDLMIVRPDGPWRCNLFRHECERPGRGAGQTENLTRMLCSLSELGNRGCGGSQNDVFFENGKKQVYRASIDVCKAARGTVSIAEIYEVIRTAPQSGADLESESWREKSYCFQSIMAAEQRSLPESQKKDFEYSAGFLIGEFPFMADKTRSSIVATATGVLDIFMRGAARDLFSTETTFIPEMCRFGGAIIVLDLSVKEFGEVGRFAQTLFKLIWQQAMERTNTVQNRRPVFLFADEFQEFCVSEDRDFQATARSSLCCTVYATQNLPSLYAAMGGGESAKQQADALIGNLSTRILHANGDQTTNSWCAEMIAKSWQYRMSFGSGSSPSREVSMIKNQTDRSVNSTVNEQLDYDVQPQEFTTLQMAGPPNWASEAIVFQAGRRWALTGKNFLRVLFPQGVS